MGSIPPALLPGNVYVSSEAYAELGEYYQHHTRTNLIFSTLIPSRSLQEGMVMCTMGPSTVQAFVSNACACILVTVHKKPPKCVHMLLLPCQPSLTELAGLLSRGCNVETVDAPEHPPATGYYHCSPSADLRLDAWWRPAGVHQEEP